MRGVNVQIIKRRGAKIGYNVTLLERYRAPEFDDKELTALNQ